LNSPFNSSNFLIKFFNFFLYFLSEHAVYREEARSLELVKIKLIERIRGLEDELKELKEAKNQTETPEVSLKIFKEIFF